jgi:hypothetical protein
VKQQKEYQDKKTKWGSLREEACVSFVSKVSKWVFGVEAFSGNFGDEAKFILVVTNLLKIKEVKFFKKTKVLRLERFWDGGSSYGFFMSDKIKEKT